MSRKMALALDTIPEQTTFFNKLKQAGQAATWWQSVYIQGAVACASTQLYHTILPASAFLRVQTQVCPAAPP